MIEIHSRLKRLGRLLLGVPEDPVAEASRLFAEAAVEAGPELSALADQLGRTWINERDHLQPQYRKALERVAGRASPRPEVSPTLGSGLEQRWPRIGKFDISLRWGGTTTVFGELKCGASESALDACVWDAAKSAMAVRCGKAAGAHLIAAAPSGLWNRRAR